MGANVCVGEGRVSGWVWMCVLGREGEWMCVCGREDELMGVPVCIKP